MLRSVVLVLTVSIWFLLIATKVYAGCGGLYYGLDSSYCQAISDIEKDPTCGVRAGRSGDLKSTGLRQSLCLSISNAFSQTPCSMSRLQPEDMRICQIVQDGFNGELCQKASTDSGSGDESPFRLCKLGARLALVIGPRKASPLLGYDLGDLSDLREKVASRLQVAISEQSVKIPRLEKRLGSRWGLFEAVQLIKLVEEFRENWVGHFAGNSENSLELYSIQPVMKELTQDTLFSPPLRVKVVLFREGHTLVYFPEILLGQGSYKKVFLGIDYDRLMKDEGDFVVAVSEGEWGDDSNDRESLKHEFELHRWLGLRSPQIPQLFKSLMVRESREYYLAVGALYDRDLSRSDYSRTSSKEKITVARKIIADLSQFHQLGFAHRDIKPANFLIRAEGLDHSVHLSDFGSAIHRFEVPREGYSSSRDFTTYQYFDPFLGKVYRSGKKVNIEILQQADVWSLGLTLYQIFHVRDRSDHGCYGSTRSWRDREQSLDFLANDLCRSCALFCDPRAGRRNEVLIPKKNTLDWVIYQLIQPDPHKRVSLDVAVKQLLFIDSRI